MHLAGTARSAATLAGPGLLGVSLVCPTECSQSSAPGVAGGERSWTRLSGSPWGLQAEAGVKHLHWGLNGVRGSLPQVPATPFGDKARRGNGEQQRPRDTSFKRTPQDEIRDPGKIHACFWKLGQSPPGGRPPAATRARLCPGGCQPGRKPPAVPVPSPHPAAGGAVPARPLHGPQERRLPGFEAQGLGAGLPEELRCCIDKLGLILQAPAAPNSHLSYRGRSCVRNTRPLRFGQTCSTPPLKYYSYSSTAESIAFLLLTASS